MIKDRVTKSPFTTVIGIIVALFALAAMWFGKIEFWNSMIMVIAGCAIIGAKDVWFRSIFSIFTKK